jgi:mRNA interferase MazF
MTYKPFSVIVVPFPFTDKSNTKNRPALVISNLEHLQHTGHVTCLMITSAKNSSWPNDHLIQDLKTAGLATSSIIRQKIFTLDARLIKKTIGKLSLPEQKIILSCMKKHLIT